MNFSAVILAGGKSSRMGRDKAFLEIQGKTLLARQIALAHEAGAKDVFISGRRGTDYSIFERPVLHDNFADAGPLAGIESALAGCACPLVLVLAVDLPRMTSNVLKKLTSKCAQNVGVVPRIGGDIEPLAAVYPKNACLLLNNLLQQGSNSAKHFADRCADVGFVAFLDLPRSEAAFFSNWNCGNNPPHDSP